MYNRGVIELTTEETQLVAFAIDFLAKEGVSRKCEIATLRKILKKIVKDGPGDLCEILADIQLTPRRP